MTRTIDKAQHSKRCECPLCWDDRVKESVEFITSLRNRRAPEEFLAEAQRDRRAALGRWFACPECQAVWHEKTHRAGTGCSCLETPLEFHVGPPVKGGQDTPDTEVAQMGGLLSSAFMLGIAFVVGVIVGVTL